MNKEQTSAQAGHAYAWIVGLLVFVFALGTQTYLQGCYQEPIERQLTEEQLKNPEIAVLSERLRSLRRSQSKMGPKHPSLQSVRGQIAANEARLREISGQLLLPVPQPVRPMGIEPKATPAVPATKPDTSSGRKEPVAEKPADNLNLWGFKRGFKWPDDLQGLSAKLKSYSAFEDAYEWLGLNQIIAVGSMPGLGLMWGIEYDSAENHSYVWQWFDHPGSTRRVRYFDCSGRLESLYFPKRFDVDGKVWMIRRLDKVKSTDSDQQSNQSTSYEIIESESQKVPPYRIVKASEQMVGTLHGQFEDNIRIVQTLDNGWFFLGKNIEFELRKKISGESLEDRSTDFPMGIQQIADGIWVLEDHSPDTNRRLNTASKKTDDIIPLAGSWSSRAPHSFLGNKSIGKDTTGNWVFVSQDGRVVRERSPASYATNSSIEKWPPKKLSELGWFTSMEDGFLVAGFERYAQKTIIGSEGVIQACFSKSTRLNPGSMPRFTKENWICIPKGIEQNVNISKADVFPEGTILLQTMAIQNSEDGNDSEGKRNIETRVLLYCNQEWFPFSYAWDPDQSDAALVESDEEETFVFGKRTELRTSLKWTYSQPSQCIECHRKQEVGFANSLLSELRTTGKLWSGQYSSRKTGLLPPWNLTAIGLPKKAQPVKWFPILATPTPFGAINGNVSKSEGEDFIDWGWYRKSLVYETIVPWYIASFRPNGFFCTELDEKWDPKANPTGTLISQTRMIYTMGIGYAVTGDQRLLEAMQKGIQFLLQKFADNKHGGFYYQVNANGDVVDRNKDGYGHAFVIYSLATAAKVSGDTRFASEALRCWAVLREKMMEPNGGLMWKAQEDFSALSRRSQNPNMHLFEGLLELYDVTRDRGVFMDANKLLQFVLEDLRDQSGVIPEDFQEDWLTPVRKEREVYFLMGHQVEWAFLISRAVELGFPSRYLAVGHELIDFCQSHGFDPKDGGLQEESGRGKGAWQQAEYLRALLRYYSMHNRSDLHGAIIRTQALIQRDFIDKDLGGWVETKNKEKGNHWKAASHEVAMYLEGIRIADTIESKDGIESWGFPLDYSNRKAVELNLNQDRSIDLLDLELTDSWANVIKPLLQKHCGDCHMESSSEGGVNFDDYTTLTKIREHEGTWEQIRGVIRAEAMPPP